MRGLGGRRFQSERDDAFDLGVAEAPRRAGTRFIEQSIEAFVEKALAPFADGAAGPAELGGDDGIVEPVGGEQNGPGALSQSLSGLAAARPTLQALALGGVEPERFQSRAGRCRLPHIETRRRKAL